MIFHQQCGADSRGFSHSFATQGRNGYVTDDGERVEKQCRPCAVHSGLAVQIEHHMAVTAELLDNDRVKRELAQAGVSFSKDSFGVPEPSESIAALQESIAVFDDESDSDC